MSASSKILAISTLIGALIIGVLGGYAVSRASHPEDASLGMKTPVEVRDNSTQYRFINPLLYVGTDKSLYADQYKGLVASLDAYIQSATSSAQAADVSVYFRDMNTGHWTGIGEDELYRPSSMTKVVTMMAALKLVEDGKISLSDTLSYAPTDPSLQYYPSDDGMSAGVYSVQDLILSMIAYSDNGSDLALLSNDDIESEFQSLYKTFRLPAAASSTDDFMSARSYSVVWRTLYNATFLSDDASEQALQLLSLSTFKDGLAAGVPASTTISHKFGEFTDETPAGAVIDRELHDCGIIYYPGHPYLLCVMTRGTDFPDLAQTIAGVSKTVYDFVASSVPAK